MKLVMLLRLAMVCVVVGLGLWCVLTFIAVVMSDDDDDDGDYDDVGGFCWWWIKDDGWLMFAGDDDNDVDDEVYVFDVDNEGVVPT